MTSLLLTAGAALFVAGYMAGRYAGVTEGLRRSSVGMRRILNPRSNPTNDNDGTGRDD